MVGAVARLREGDGAALDDSVGVGSTGMYWDAVVEGAVAATVADAPRAPLLSRTPR